MPVSNADHRRDVGSRLRRHRERSGKSRAVLAGLVGKSEDWLKKIERGERGLPLGMAAQVARELGIRDLAALYGGDLSAPVQIAECPAHPAAEMVGHALTEYLPDTEAAPSVDHYTAAVARAWRDWHSSPTQRTYAAGELPGLIRAGRAAVRESEGDARKRARGALADVYHLCQAYLAWQENGRHWYWLSVDRGQQTGEDADDPAARAASLLYSSFALRVTDRAEQALEMLETATRTLDPRLADGDDETRALWGAVQLARASTTARQLKDPSAWVHWERAATVVDTLSPHYGHHHHGFSRQHVDLHKTWIAQSLGDATEALRHADDVDVDAIPSRSWQASHLVNVSRALHQQRDSGALIPLLQAERYSSEALRFSVSARDVVISLATTGRSTIRSEATRLAERLDILA
ncbi:MULTISPECIES: helix-turn-helix domain-containing protein [Actinoalloteichus]|uniref:DNA binding protein with helix-turn-helix domain n=1 Tax=Actinoalloteichus fjordicus TaxID=1612552 RepID=A0AAC9LDQ6_9PSEU|nr:MULTISPECIES: helix-turn-helix transcriptional regulator [Actinoalloteichus]APU14807.1 DNA binding protein with helix-turn-helix domain [Actinoalloteichus fjordicus]APU20778.1 DNA binding protein with helix-turn-helix domain [Actinoalloteichus sp. GBA129-24]